MPAGIETERPGANVCALSISSLSPIPAWKLPDKTVTFSVVAERRARRRRALPSLESESPASFSQLPWDLGDFCALFLSLPGHRQASYRARPSRQSRAALSAEEEVEGLATAAPINKSDPASSDLRSSVSCAHRPHLSGIG